MLHQMLISHFISFHPSSSSSSSLSLPYSHSSQVEKEKKMEHESGNQLQLEPDQELAWAVEKGNHIFGEEFVDEFLDLGGLTETEKEDDDGKDNGEREKNGTEEEEDNSAVSFEPPPPVSDLAFPAHDVAELEWVSRLMDDSLSEFPPCSVAAAVPPKPPAQETSSVVPVPEIEVRVRAKAKAKRSKRNRSPSGSWSNWGPPDYSTSSSSSSSTTTTTTTTTIPTSSSSCPSPSYSSSSPLIFFTPLPDVDPPPTKKQKIPKKRGRKPKPRPTVLPSGREENQQYYQNSLSLTSAAADRRCSHCGVNKTPQWRAGPMGAKTLCNACGVRYKSGRLLPEYRPACSPTFLSHVHSNSHRKVLEMRKKKESVEQNQNDDNNIQVCSAAPAVPSF